MNKYCVKFEYYQYNTGLADNGYYTRSIFVKEYLQAKMLVDKIRTAGLNKDIDSDGYEEAEKLANEYLPNPGWFTGKTEIFEVTETEIKY